MGALEGRLKSMKWLAQWSFLGGVVLSLLILVAFVLYWFRGGPKIYALATVARVDVTIGPAGRKEYSTRVRLFGPNLNSSNEWWPIGTFATGVEAAEAIRKFHGDRVTTQSWCAFFDEYGKPSVVELGSLNYEREASQD